MIYSSLLHKGPDLLTVPQGAGHTFTELPHTGRSELRIQSYTILLSPGFVSIAAG
jgi:hypothetical protein